MSMNFTKMHGLGNDFVVIDATREDFSLTENQIRNMADRHEGVGFDQLLVLEQPSSRDADFRYRIFNADGGEVEQCGNGARCIARYIHDHHLLKGNEYHLETMGGTIRLLLEDEELISVEMGIPYINSRFKQVELSSGEALPITHVTVGNPHVVIPVSSLTKIDIAAQGQEISTHQQFPDGVNVGFMQIISPEWIILQVYERGSGQTFACGSGACAAVAAGRELGLLGEEVVVEQPGGALVIRWPDAKQPLIMVGPAETVFEGEWL